MNGAMPPNLASRLSAFEREALILPVQSALARLDWLATALGASVTSVLLLPLFSSLYWALDAPLCLNAIWLVPASEVANGLAKWRVRRPRPGWVDPRVRALSWSAEYSFPSSHSQLAFSLAHFFVRASRTPQALTVTPPLPAYAYATAVALSRVHAGLHYPSDVIIGSLWGVASAELYHRLLPTLLRLDPGTPAKRLAALSPPLLLAAAALLLGYRAALRAARARPDPRTWRENACSGKHKRRHAALDPINEPLGLYTGMLGVLFGLGVGISLKQLLPPLPYPASTRQGLIRALLGNLGLITLFETIGALTPRQPTAVYACLRFLKYASVPMYILLLAPPAFLAVGL